MGCELQETPAKRLSVYSTLPKVRAAQAVRAALAGGISKLGNEKISKCGGLRSSKDNGEERKRVERSFGEKVL